VRKYVVPLTLTVLQALAVALSIFFCAVMRPELARIYGAGTPGPVSLPWEVRFAFSAWLVPGGATLGGALTLLAWVLRMRPRRRIVLLGTGLVVSVFPLAFAVGAGYVPLLG
jgi:hypothetical protein